MFSTTWSRPLGALVVACVVGLCTTGCATQDAYPKRPTRADWVPATTLTGKPSDWDATSTIRPPTDWNAFDKTLTLVIDSSPSGADVFSVEGAEEGALTVGEKIGTTPLEIRIGFCEAGQLVWFRDPAILDGRLTDYRAKGAPIRGFLWPTDIVPSWPKRGAYWSPVVKQEVCIKSRSGNSSGTYWSPYMHEVHVAGDLYVARNELKRSTDETSEYNFKVYITHVDCYGAYVNTGFRFDNMGSQVVGARGEWSTVADGVQVRPYGCPFRLLKHGRVLAQDMATAIEQEDYYGAEELRLRRIDELERQLGSNKTFFDAVAESAPTITNAVHAKLIESELDRLKHLVGLLDPQLMGLRKQMLAKLKEGDVDAAFVLAQAIEAMEKRYFPPEPSRTIVVREPSTATSTVASAGAGVAQASGPQEIVVQEKPYYGVTNIIQALGAIRGSKLDPEGYQRALGGAQLMDIMGVGAGVLNK